MRFLLRRRLRRALLQHGTIEYKLQKARRYKIVWWKMDTDPVLWTPEKEEEFDLASLPVDQHLKDSDLSRRYKELQESPDVLHLEIWRQLRWCSNVHCHSAWQIVKHSAWQIVKRW